MKEHDVIKMLMDACKSLMGEVIGKSVTDWAVVNEAMIQGQKVISIKREG